MKKNSKIEEVYINIHTSFNKEIFTIYGCGKFQESKKNLTKAEASILYIELHKWLFPSILT